MTPEAQRLAIAEACGKHYYLGIIGAGNKCTKCNKYYENSIHRVGDYLNDLNAMHEAEKARIIGNYSVANGDLSIEASYRMRVGTFATAAQRAEAFLRTLGLWKE